MAKKPASPPQTEMTAFQSERLGKTVLKLADKHLDAERFYAVSCEFVKDMGHWALRLYVEGRHGRISLDECAEISRSLDEPIDALPELLAYSYHFEVSSPGLFRMIETERELSFYQGWAAQFVHKDADNPDFVEAPLPEALPEYKGVLLAYEADSSTVRFAPYKEASRDESVELCLRDFPDYRLRLAPEVHWPGDDDESDDELNDVIQLNTGDPDDD